MTNFLKTITVALAFLMACAGKALNSQPIPMAKSTQIEPAVREPSHEQQVERVAADATAPPVAVVDASPPVPVVTEQEAYERAKPIFEKYCARCHTKQSAKRTALKHFAMDSYPFDGHHTDNMPSTIRKVLGVSGSRATMPRDKPGIIQGNELRLILDWADAVEGARTNTLPGTSDAHKHHR